MTITTADNASHALFYAELGWRVLPIRPGEKVPAIDEWPTAATTDAGLIMQWFSRWPTHGVGIACGPGSGFFVLDVDPRNGGDESLADLEAEHGKLPDTVEAITGGGGRHLLYAWPALTDDQRLANSKGALGPGLDVKADGGQIVVAPSVHPETQRPYEWEASSLPGSTPIAEAPGWLLALVIETHEPAPEGQVAPGEHADLAYAWDRYRWTDPNATAQMILERHGWHSPRIDRRDGWIAMTRPGKASGVSCSIGKPDRHGTPRPGVVQIFTSSCPPLAEEGKYDPPQLLAKLEHDGDMAAADAALVANGWGLPSIATPKHNAELAAFYDYQRRLRAIEEPEAEEHGAGPQPIRWPEFWTRERKADDWAIAPVVPAGRLVTVWAKRKTGKSLFVLDIAAAAATGRSIMGRGPMPPIDVVYLDLEMTEDDLEERLSDLGYGPDDDLSRFHYYLLPTLPPLDQEAGGKALMGIVERHRPAVVVIDTMARVVSGEENSADTYRAFYRATGMLLKQAGVACVRLDHAGKQTDKGERGSSAKGDDVDLSWELQEVGGGEFNLKRSYTRISWAPEIIRMRRETDPLRHTSGMGGWLQGTGPCAEHLDDLQAPIELTVTAAVDLLRKHDRSPRKREIVASALKFRQERAENGAENATSVEDPQLEETERERPHYPWSPRGER